MSRSSLRNIACLLLVPVVVGMLLVAPASARLTGMPDAQAALQPVIHERSLAPKLLDPNTDGPTKAPQASNRLIVEFNSPPLSRWVSQSSGASTVNGRPDLKS